MCVTDCGLPLGGVQQETLFPNTMLNIRHLHMVLFFSIKSSWSRLFILSPSEVEDGISSSSYD